MKKTFVFFALLLTAACFSACRQEELPRVEFDGQNYELAFSAQQPAGRINEYRLPNENLEKYSKMIAVYSFPGLKEKTPQQAVKHVAAAVQDNNIAPTYEIHPSADKNAAIIDFLVFGPGATMAEYNIFKYVKENDQMKALQFVARWYGSKDETSLKNAQDFATTYLENRQEWIKKIDALPLPTLYEQDYSIPSTAETTQPSATLNTTQPETQPAAQQ